MKQKVILLTGASSGIGYDTATRLARQGHKVYGAARRIDKMQPLKKLGVTPIKMDVTDDASMIAGVNAVLEAEGRIDVLVNNAGYGYFGAIENVSMEEARKQLEVNVFGLARLTQLVIPHMRQQGSGRIVNLASIAGKLALYFGGWYHVSKFAVEGFSDALRMELKPFGIDVVIIEPGASCPQRGQRHEIHLHPCKTTVEPFCHRQSHLQRREQKTPQSQISHRHGLTQPGVPALAAAFKMVGWTDEKLGEGES